jgi:hypothetical protein
VSVKPRRSWWERKAPGNGRRERGGWAGGGFSRSEWNRRASHARAAYSALIEIASVTHVIYQSSGEVGKFRWTPVSMLIHRAWFYRMPVAMSVPGNDIGQLEHQSNQRVGTKYHSMCIFFLYVASFYSPYKSFLTA